MDLDGFCHIHRTIRTRCFPEGFLSSKFNKSLPQALMRSMHFSLLQIASVHLAVLLATVPVRLISLLNLRIPVNQFVRRLYMRRPHLRSLLEGLNLPLFKPMANTMSWDASSKYIRFAFLLGSGPVMPDGYVSQTATRPMGLI
jgi:hypothetical protein